MNELLKTVLSLSLSASALILLLLLAGPLLRDRVSKRWQYYIWLVVIVRLLLPFGPEGGAVGALFQHGEEAAGETIRPVYGSEASMPETEDGSGGVFRAEAGGAVPGPGAALQYLWLVWLGTALFLLARKLTAYQEFMKYIRAGSREAGSVELLERLAAAGGEAGVRRPVELWINPMISSPMLIGFFHPCIVLPGGGMPEADFEYVVRHELVHCKRMDLIYKWLVQFTVCLHWFNPLVWRMSREIGRACELACDEGVIASLDGPGRRAYGDMLMRAAEAGGRGRVPAASMMLGEGKELLKERLEAIMKFRKKTGWTALLSLSLAGALALGAAAAGVYTGPDAPGPAAPPAEKRGAQREREADQAAAQAERYYEAGSLPLFQIVFSRLDEKTQKKWLEKLYAEDDFAFFSVAVRGLDTDSSMLAGFAEKAYAGEEIAFFSVLTDCMDETEIQLWLDRALEDGKWDFQSMLFDRLDKSDEFEALEEKKEKEQAEAQAAEYRAAGVTMEGKNYYYRGQLVHVLLDVRQPTQSICLLEINPAGTASIRIVRDQSGRITGAAYLTGEELEELLGGEDAGEDEAAEEIPVCVDRVEDGGYAWLGTYTLCEGDRISYHVSARSGTLLKIGFAEPGQDAPDTAYLTAASRRSGGRLAVQAGPLVVREPVRPGTYRLFLCAGGGSLGNVEGSVTISR